MPIIYLLNYASNLVLAKPLCFFLRSYFGRFWRWNNSANQDNFNFNSEAILNLIFSILEKIKIASICSLFYKEPLFDSGNKETNQRSLLILFLPQVNKLSLQQSSK